MVGNGEHEGVRGGREMITTTGKNTDAPKLDSCTHCAHGTREGEKCYKAYFVSTGRMVMPFQAEGQTCEAFVQQGSVEGKKQ